MVLSVSVDGAFTQHTRPCPSFLPLLVYIRVSAFFSSTIITLQLFNTFTNFHTFYQTHQSTSIIMSAPNADKPNDGIVDQITNSAKNATNYVTESLQGNAAAASKEGNKEQAKGNVPGNNSISDRVSGATGAVSDTLNQKKHDGSAEANKRSI